MNFKEYWKENKELFEQLGVTEAVVKKIWNDCADVMQKKVMDYYISKL
jgi:DNA-binding Xre family transcriptional regulator